MGRQYSDREWQTKDAGSVPAEVKTMFDGLQKTLQDMREKHAQEVKEAQKRGSADVVVRDQVKRMEQGVDRLKDDVDALFKRVARSTASAPVLDAKAAEIETKANREFASWSGEEDLVKAARHRMAYKAAFDKMIRRGEKALSAEETKTLSVGSAPDGGFYVDPARASFIVERLRETSQMRSLATVETISAPSFKIPIDRDDVGYEWVGEQSARNVTATPQVGDMEIPVHELSAMPKATQNMLDDAGMDVEGWTNGKIADRFARAENNAFVVGNGTNKPRGFLTGTPSTAADSARAFGTLQYIATGASGAFATASASVSPADKLLDLIYAFNAGYRRQLQWCGTRVTLGAVRKFKDQQGNYIYDPRLGANGIIDMVLGHQWNEFADMADFTTANAFGIALGDFKRGYLIVDRQGIRQLRDVYTSKPYVLFYTTKRVGGGVVDSDAIKLLKFGTS